jgi:hypothetical protein
LFVIYLFSPFFFNETCKKKIHQSNKKGKGNYPSLQNTTQPKTHKTST